jgi:dephospho-CoA kinase
MVTAPLELRVQRVMQRDGLSREEIISRDSRQFSEEKKLALADYAIRNDNKEMVIPQVLALHEVFISSLVH